MITITELAYCLYVINSCLASTATAASATKLLQVCSEPSLEKLPIGAVDAQVGPEGSPAFLVLDSVFKRVVVAHRQTPPAAGLDDVITGGQEGLGLPLLGDAQLTAEVVRSYKHAVHARHAQQGLQVLDGRAALDVDEEHLPSVELPHVVESSFRHDVRHVLQGVVVGRGLLLPG